MFQQFDSFGYFDSNQDLFARDLSSAHGRKIVMIPTPMAATGFYDQLLEHHARELERLREEDTVLEQASRDTEMDDESN